VIQISHQLILPHPSHLMVDLLLLLNNCLGLMTDHIRKLIQHIVLNLIVTDNQGFSDVVCCIDLYEKVERF
jgi:hypothetical protein